MLTRWMAVGWWSVLVMAVAFGQLRLPSLISDHMVLQRDMPVRLWGTAAPNERVTVRFRGQEIATTADEKGRWQVTLPPAPAGGPFDLVVRGGDSEIVVRDVLVGEVWVASGQSNMEWPVAMAMNAEQEIAQANDAQIRFFQVPHRVAETPQEEGQGAWRVCSPETVKNFSAVAYFFARELRQHLKVPVGVIQATWGGTPAEAWTSLPTLQSDPAFRPLLDRWAKILAEYPAARQRYEAELQKWREAAEQAKAQGKPVPPLGPEHPHRPANLFNGMIAPRVCSKMVL
jgi:sialate O-acetylesterase